MSAREVCAQLFGSRRNLALLKEPDSKPKRCGRKFRSGVPEAVFHFSGEFFLQDQGDAQSQVPIRACTIEIDGVSRRAFGVSVLVFRKVREGQIGIRSRRMGSTTIALLNRSTARSNRSVSR